MFKAVDGVTFAVNEKETLGIAGESGCGKTVTALSILRILPKNARIVEGRILLRSDGRVTDLTKLKPTGREIREVRGRDISMIFQEPMTSLSPVHTIGNQIGEVIRLHQRCTRKETRVRTLEMLSKVGMPKPEQMIDAYPFTMSGGMRQRAMAAMALCCRPRVLIADEPTTALDVTIQAQILELMQCLQEEMGMGLILITHDLAVIAQLCDRVLVMYLGKSVECAPVRSMFRNPRHPYTQGLLNSIPKLTRDRQKLESIAGSVPSLYEVPAGCAFHPRCPRCMPVCKERAPSSVAVGPGHTVRCFLYGE